MEKCTQNRKWGRHPHTHIRLHCSSASKYSCECRYLACVTEVRQDRLSVLNGLRSWVTTWWLPWQQAILLRDVGGLHITQWMSAENTGSKYGRFHPRPKANRSTDRFQHCMLYWLSKAYGWCTCWTRPMDDIHAGQDLWTIYTLDNWYFKWQHNLHMWNNTTYVEFSLNYKNIIAATNTVYTRPVLCKQSHNCYLANTLYFTSVT